MTNLNHNHGNDTGNGNQSDRGDGESGEGRPERPGIIYGGLHKIKPTELDGRFIVETIPLYDPTGWSRVTIENVDSDSTEARR